MDKTFELLILLLLCITNHGFTSYLPSNSTFTVINSSTNTSNPQDLPSFFTDLMNKFSINSSKTPDILDFIKSSQFSPQTNLKNFAEKIADSHEYSPNSTVFIDCNLTFKKALKNSKMLAFKNCDPGKVLVNENFTRIFDVFPSAFMVTFEVEKEVEEHGRGTSKKLKPSNPEEDDDITSNLKASKKFEHFSSVEVQKIEQNFDNFHRSFLILIYDGKIEENQSKIQELTKNSNSTSDNAGKSMKNPQNSPQYSTYLLENSHLTHLKNSNSSKFSLGNFIASLDSQLTGTSLIDYDDKITESLTNNCPICLRTLQLLNLKSYLFNLEIPNGKQLRKFHCDFDCFRALLITPTDFNFTNIPEYISILLHEKFINSLKIKTSDVISMNENATVDEFMELNSVTMELEGLTTLAFLQRQFKVLEFLIRADCPYPVNFTADKTNSRMFPMKNRFVQILEKHKENIKKFHKDIKNGDINAVSEFLRENKDIKFARDEENKSALKVAFENDQLKIYALLKVHGMMMSSLEEVVEKYKKINDLNDSERTIIRHSNYKFLTPVAKEEESYIEKLVQKSKFNFDQSSYTKDQIISEIRRAFIDVNETTPEILEICSKSEDLVIIFDFDYAIVDEFEPGSTAVGLAQRQYDYVVIAANEYLSRDKDERNYALGTLSHELMHYAMFLVYDNDAYPYLDGDFETKNLFRNFTEKCKKFEITEPHLAYPDESDPDEFQVELIARVPDVLLIKKNQPLVLDKIKAKFSELFDFYYGKILQDIREMTATMSDREKVREVNQWLDVSRQIEEFQIEIIVKDEGSDCLKSEEKENKENKAEESADDQDEDEERVNEISTAKSLSAQHENEVHRSENGENSLNNANKTKQSGENGEPGQNSQEPEDYFEDDDNIEYSEHNENDIQNPGAINNNINQTTKSTTNQTQPKISIPTPIPYTNSIPKHLNSIENEDTQDNNIKTLIEATTAAKFQTNDEDYLESGEFEASKLPDTSNYDDDYEDENNSNYFKKRKIIDKKRSNEGSLRMNDVDFLRKLSSLDYFVEVEGHTGPKSNKKLKKSQPRVSNKIKNLNKVLKKEAKQENDVKKEANVFKNPKSIRKDNNVKTLKKTSSIDPKLAENHSKVTENHPKIHKRSTNSSEQKADPQFLQNHQNSSTSKQNQSQDNFILNLGFEFSSNQSQHVIFTNFPKAVLKFILKKVNHNRQLAVFLKLSSMNLDNFHKFINDISNLNSDVLLVIDCDEIEFLPGFVNTINGYSFKHVIFVADKGNLDDFENYEDKMEMKGFSVLWDDLCPKGQNYLSSYTFYFQNDEMELSQIIGNNKSILNQFAMEKIYNQDVFSIATDSVPENEEFYVEMRLIDEDGMELGLNKVIRDVFELEDEEVEENKNEDDEDNDGAWPKKLGNILESSKKLEGLKKAKIDENQHKKVENFEKSTNIQQILSKNSIKPTKKVKENLQKSALTSKFLSMLKIHKKFTSRSNKSANTQKPFDKIFKKSTNPTKIPPVSSRIVKKTSRISSKYPKKSSFPQNVIIGHQVTPNDSSDTPKNLQNSSLPQKSTATFKIPRNSTTFILTSPPGSGKSTTLKEMSSKIREISPNLWVAYVNLSEIDFNSNFTSEDILLFLTENVLKLVEIDALVFNHLFYEQRIVLLFDEIDKIEGNLKENFIKIIKFCERHSVTIWISTRPSNLKILQNNLKNPKIFKLSEFSKSDREKFLEFFDENREAEILEFLEKVGKIGNPKMIHEIAEIFETHENISNFYQIYTQLILNRNFGKSLKSQKLNDIEEALSSPQKLLKAHQYEALNYLYPQEILTSLNLTNESTDIVENYEIICKNSENQTRFIHNSFAAYFVGQYFIENLIKNEKPSNNFEENWKLLIEATKFKSWRLVRKFLNDFIEINKDKLDSRRILRVKMVFEEI